MPPMPPPNATMQGPPAGPPESPTLSAFPTAGPGPGQGGSPAGKMEAIPKLIFMIDQLLDTLARAVPGASEEVDSAKATIRGVLTKALQGGPAGTQGPSPVPPGPQGGMGGNPVPGRQPY